MTTAEKILELVDRIDNLAFQQGQHDATGLPKRAERVNTERQKLRHELTVLVKGIK